MYSSKAVDIIKQAIDDVGTDPHDIALRIYDIKHCDAEKKVKNLKPAYVYDVLSRWGIKDVKDIKQIVDDIKEGV